jgi:hypothetical protein
MLGCMGAANAQVALSAAQANVTSSTTSVGVGVGEGGQATGAISNTNSTSNSTYKTQKQAPGFGLAGLAASSGCLGSTTVGGSGIGFGLGFGSTYQDERCNAREDARLLYSMGYRAQAVQILVNHSPMVQEVMIQPTQVSAGGGRVVASTGCRKWSGGSKGAGVCVR